MRLLPTVLLVLLASPAVAEPVGGADLLRELSDQTLTGFNGSLLFSEYHAPDGKVLGHNAGVPNRDSCWRVRGDAVCYYYPHLQREGATEGVESCWTFERAGPNGYKITPVGSARSGIARLEPGNARGHSTNGRDWTCEALISRHDRQTPMVRPISRATCESRSVLRSWPKTPNVVILRNPRSGCLEGRTSAGACFETRPRALLSMTPAEFPIVGEAPNGAGSP